MMQRESSLPPRSSAELLQRYANGERDFTEAELDDVVYDLRNVTLEGADFSRSFIVADFQGANLKDAKFVSANVKTCDFRGANLQGANFACAALESTQWEGANLQDANFEGASVMSYQLKAGEKPDW
jgi:uncharacterized protein YjbI with pentapeptide repeats